MKKVFDAEVVVQPWNNGIHFVSLATDISLQFCFDSSCSPSQFLGFQDDQIWSASQKTVRFFPDSNPISCWSFCIDRVWIELLESCR
ncbi:hypothetical protein HanRHA438_Chr08g0340321 [Helianthus annuus]|nr:hypothetical protein HanRHA438_Chr08g0340321 [Helianthus annuus]